jgi:hypothetical protein
MIGRQTPVADETFPFIGSSFDRSQTPGKANSARKGAQPEFFRRFGWAKAGALLSGFLGRGWGRAKKGQNGRLSGKWAVFGGFGGVRTRFSVSILTKSSQRTAFFGKKTSPDRQRTACAEERTWGISLRTASVWEGRWEISLSLARFGVGTAEISLSMAVFGESSTALGERSARFGGGTKSSKRVARGGRRRRLAALEEPLTKLT